MKSRNVTVAAAAALALAVAVQGASAQTNLLPWVGCWAVEGAEDDSALCVLPSEAEVGVEVLHVADSEILAREMVWADGQRHETVREGCEGWERGTFSADGRRVFLSSEHTCEDGSVQKGAGVMSITQDDEWLDVRTLEIDGRPSAWVQRYSRTYGQPLQDSGAAEVLAQRGMSVRAARSAAMTELDIADVVEAAALLPTEAVEAWLAETGDPFDLDGATLLALDDAGVPSEVIDVLVAVSNPRVFQLAADGDAERMAPDGGSVRTAYAPGAYYGDPFYSRRYRYSPYAYGYGFGYGALGYGSGGYGYGGYGYGGYGYRPTIIVVEPRQNDQNHGRVIKGRGYRRPSSGASTGGVAGGSSAGRSSSGGSSSASPSTGGSSTKSGGPVRRKAKPRGGKKPGGAL